MTQDCIGIAANQHLLGTFSCCTWNLIPAEVWPQHGCKVNLGVPHAICLWSTLPVSRLLLLPDTLGVSCIVERSKAVRLSRIAFSLHSWLLWGFSGRLQTSSSPALSVSTLISSFASQSQKEVQNTIRALFALPFITQRGRGSTDLPNKQCRGVDALSLTGMDVDNKQIC